MAEASIQSVHNELISQLNEMGFSQDVIDAAIKKASGSDPMTIECLLNAIDEIQKGDNVNEQVDVKNEPETAESIEARRQMIEQKIAQRRKEREEQEKQLEIEKEMKRRKDGIEMTKTREEIQNLQRIKMAEDLRREKLEAKLAKEAVLREIEKDRMERRSREAAVKNELQNIQTVITSANPSSSGEHTKCLIAIKLPDGRQVQQDFDAKESLAAVRTFALVQGNVPAGQEVMLSMPPSPPFSEEDMLKPLNVLGLCPRARLQMRCKQAAV